MHSQVPSPCALARVTCVTQRTRGSGCYILITSLRLFLAGNKPVWGCFACPLWVDHVYNFLLHCFFLIPHNSQANNEFLFSSFFPHGLDILWLQSCSSSSWYLICRSGCSSSFCYLNEITGRVRLAQWACAVTLTYALPILLVPAHFSRTHILIRTHTFTLPLFITSFNTSGTNHCMQTHGVTYLALVVFQNMSLRILHVSSGVTLSASSSPKKCLNPF